VVRIIEGPVALGEGAGAGKGHRSDTTSTDGQRATDAVFAEVSQRIAECLDTVTVADVCDKADALGIRRPGAQGYVYSI
jgi:DNA-binding IscR family transcriptional regulator